MRTITEEATVRVQNMRRSCAGIARCLRRIGGDRITLGPVAAMCAMLLTASASLAQRASASHQNNIPLAGGPGGAAATFSLCTRTQAGGSTNTPSSYTITSGIPFVTVPGPGGGAVAACAIGTIAGVGVGPLAKPALPAPGTGLRNDRVTTWSPAGVDVAAPAPPWAMANADLISSSALGYRVGASAGGAGGMMAMAGAVLADAEAIDPYTLEPGEYPFDVSIGDLEIVADTNGATCGVRMYGISTALAEPLWNLELLTMDQANDLGALQVQLAINETAFPGLVPTGQSLQDVVNAIITDMLQNISFDASTHTFSLPGDYTLFAAMLQADVTAEYSEGVAASVATRCGNGIVDPGEVCDDGNTDETDGCLSTCTLGATPVGITSSNPPDGHIDPLDTGPGNALTAGIGGAGTAMQGPVQFATIAVTFDGEPSVAPTLANVNLTCTPSVALCPTVVDVAGSGSGPYQIALSGVIPPLNCVTLSFDGPSFVPGTSLQYRSSPGNVNFDLSADKQDVLSLTQALGNGTANTNPERYNVDRSTGPGPQVNTQDVLRLINLLNGFNTVRRFYGTPMPECQ